MADQDPTADRALGPYRRQRVDLRVALIRCLQALLGSETGEA